MQRHKGRNTLGSPRSSREAGVAGAGGTRLEEGLARKPGAWEH